MANMTPDQISFTNAFNNQRVTLAGFAKCVNQEELDIVRDALYLGLAHDLQLPEYSPIQRQIVMDESVADTTGTTDGFSTLIHVARKLDEWPALINAVDQKAEAVGSDLKGIWKTLEQGRLEWLRALNGAHSIKTLLKQGLEKDAQHTEGDVSDAKMLYIYALSLNIPSLKEASQAWSQAVKMENATQPLVGYKPDLWDPRKDEWRQLDLGVQSAAERGGSSFSDAWDA